MSEKLVVIDAFSHLYQFFFAIKGLTGPDGEPVNAVYGFARMLRKLMDEYRPDYMAVAFDAPGELERRKTYPEYKAGRTPMPDSLVRQIPLVHELLDVHGIPRIQEEGQEADDLLGSIARMASEQGVDTIIVTTDKDAEQLIDEHVSVLHVHKDREIMLDPEALKETKGLEPWQVVEMMALAGDSTDNIPGVPGIGPKTAQKLIAQFGSVENLYTHLDEVSSDKMRQKLVDHRENVELSEKLVRLNTTAPVHTNLDECRTGTGDPEEIKRFYKALGFASLLPRDNPKHGATARQTTMFGSEPEAPSELQGIADLDTDYKAITDMHSLHRLVETLRGLEAVSVDLETTSLQPRDAEIVGVALSWEPHQGVYVATAAPDGEPHCPVDEAMEALRPVLEAAVPGKMGQNLKYDIAVLKNYGIELGGIICDSMVASYLLTPATRGHGLDALSARYLGYKPVPIERLIGEKRGKQKRMDEVPVGKVAPYACEDADLALLLCRRLRPDLRERHLEELFERMELPLVPVLADMEWTGVKVDVQELAALSADFAEELTQLERDIHSEAGAEFNINSPKQLSEVLFEKLELPAPRGARRTTGYSTAVDVLEGLRDEHAIVEHVLRHRELTKLKSTYADALAEAVNPRTGRVHASFNQTVTATGRLSSSDPNLQNIPVRTALGRRIRSAFVPIEDDMSILGADYSQVELRIMAHCSGDETLRRAFEEDRDIHRFVAAQVYDVPEEDVSDDMRQHAKAVNFGIIYGLSAYGLSKQIGITVPEAEEFIAGYFRRYPRVKRFIGETVSRARQQGYVETLAGRRRVIEGIRSTGASRSAAERIAVNTVVQGTAADLIKLAMIEIHRGLPSVSKRARMLMQIHDELVFEAPDEELDDVRRFVIEKMTGALNLEVKLRVETSTGKNWAEAK